MPSKNDPAWDKAIRDFDEGLQAKRAYLSSIKSRAKEKIPERLARAERLCDRFEWISKKTDTAHFANRRFFARIYLLVSLWYFAVLEVEMEKIHAAMDSEK